MRSLRLVAIALWLVVCAACAQPESYDDGSGSDVASQGVRFRAYITGYTYYTNTPPSTARVSHPVIHREAGGTGTYQDPVTVAVGHSRASGRSILDYEPGTRFYMPYLEKYFIVEDTCGDGPTPEKIPCHNNTKGPEPWLDIWLDGKGLGAAETYRCATGITGVRDVIQNPPNNLPVRRGNICM